MKLKIKLISFFLITFLLGIFSPRIAFADTFTLSGNISVASGADIVSASIDVKDINTNASVGSTITDGLGNYTLVLNGGTYDVQVTPPAGSNFSSAIALSQSITVDTVLNFVLVPAGTVTLSGYVYDSLGNAIPGQDIELINSSTNGLVDSSKTDSLGAYSLQVVAGTYLLRILGGTNNLSLAAPQEYSLFVNNYALNQSKILDIILPTKKVTVHTQDASGSPLNNVRIKAQGSGTGYSIGGDITFAFGFSRYDDLAFTNISGDAILWLMPNQGNFSPYTFTAIPPSGSGFLQTNLSNIVITSDTTQIITLTQPVVLSGHVYDSLGNVMSGQPIELLNQSTNQLVGTSTTDSLGVYSIQVTAGTYFLRILGGTSNFSVAAPQEYSLFVNNYSLTQNTVLDITVPARKVTVQVQDGSGNPVSNVQIATQGSGTGYSIGGNITSAFGNSKYSNISTDSSGSAILWLFPTQGNASLYVFTAIPPSGSPFLTKILSNISVTTDMNVTITLQQPVTLNGRIYDRAGNILPNQTVLLIDPSTNAEIGSANSDGSGNYLLAVSSGTYTLIVRATNNDSSLNAPQQYDLYKNSFSLNQDTTLDTVLPVKKVTIHVQDQANNPVSNIDIKAEGSGSGYSIGGGITDAFGFSKYNSGAMTDSSGDVILWLFPTQGNASPYTFTATPPSGTIYLPFTLNNIVVSGDQTEIISLQFIHDAPVTTATLSPNADNQGNYSDPTTVILSATVASGFTIANTYYTVDGRVQQTYTSPFTVSGGGEHTITYWSIDNVGVPESPKTKTFTIHVNQAPIVSSISNTTLNEGDTYSALGSFTDPDSISWTATVDYGDGSGVQPLTLSGTNFSLSHLYKDNGTYTVIVSVTDNQGVIGDTTSTITVNNVNPNVSAITASTSPVQVGTQITASASFTDPGVLDTHTASWNWGDGTTSGTVTELNGSGSVSDTHTYTSAGVYTITLTVTDKDGGIGTSTFQYVVVYDPGAGYVTGAGTITSPTGAYTQDPSLSGKAIFGFVSKYQNGANQPTGSTQFRFIIANFSFKSTSYDWLVVGGGRAQYKGSGTINGSGDYGFILTSIDGQINGGGGLDKFRIKIIDKTTGNVLYDNQQGASDTSDPATAIDSGSITIHN